MIDVLMVSSILFSITTPPHTTQIYIINSTPNVGVQYKLLDIEWNQSLQYYFQPIMSAIKKMLRLPHNFIVKPAPGWSQLTCLEVAEIFRNPWAKYKYTPNAEVSPTKEITLTNMDFRQGMEVTCRLLCAHDVEWIIAKSRCKSRGELHRFLTDLPFHALVGESNKATICVQGYSNRSFVDSSSLLRDEFASQLFKQTGESINTSSSLQAQTTPSHPRTKFKLTMLDNFITLSVSMAGADSPLFKRGYKHLTTDSSTTATAATTTTTIGLAAGSVTREEDSGSSGVKRNHAVAPLPEHHASACFRATVQAFAEAHRPAASCAPTTTTTTTTTTINKDLDNSKGTFRSSPSGSVKSSADDRNRASNLSVLENDQGLVDAMHCLMGQRLRRVYVPYAGTGACYLHITLLFINA
jgi:hypothetical protein